MKVSLKSVKYGNGGGSLKIPAAPLNRDPRKRLRILKSKKKSVSTQSYPFITSTPSHQEKGTGDFASLPPDLQNIVHDLPGEERVQAIAQKDAVVEILFPNVKKNIEEYYSCFRKECNCIIEDIVVLKSSIILFQQRIAKRRRNLIVIR